MSVKTDILITRPQPSAQHLAGLLENAGFSSIIMPFYSFSACSPSVDIQSEWSVHKGRKLAVFTSPRSVEYGLAYLPSPVLQDIDFAAVGGATCRQLELAGHEVQHRALSGYTSEDLLQVSGLTKNPGAAIIFCAPDGRKTLARGLAAIGWKVLNATVYERIPLTAAPEQLDKLLVTQSLLSTWTSISAVALAQECLPQPAWAKILAAPALAISTRIQHHLQHLGAKQVDLASGPGNDALLQSIIMLVR